VPPKKVAGRNVHEAILLDELFALCAFACARRAKDYKVYHRDAVRFTVFTGSFGKSR